MKSYPIKTETVSTHSRPKAAGVEAVLVEVAAMVSTHSRPKAAGYQVANTCYPTRVSTHSRPKAAGIIC